MRKMGHLTFSKRAFLLLIVSLVLFYISIQYVGYYALVNTDEKIIYYDKLIRGKNENHQSPYGLKLNNVTMRVKDSSFSNIFFIKSFFKSFWTVVEKNMIRNISVFQDVNSQTPNEIHRLFKHLYLPTFDGQFQCFLSGERINHSKINDEFCDCHDGSDEPSTSACKHGRFYCAYQSATEEFMWVPSNYVGDGVCDCCDGSDESKPFKVPSNEAENNETTCPDRCFEIKKKEKHVLQLKKDGENIKKRWIEEISHNGDILNNRLYGSNGEFYKLKTSPCWLFTKSKYTYNVCPFDQIVQESHNGKITIGKNPKWLKYSSSMREKVKPMEYRHFLLLSDGDTNNCPNGQSRKTRVIFICDIVNKVLSVAENEVCSYKVTFSTPAAC